MAVGPPAACAPWELIPNEGAFVSLGDGQYIRIIRKNDRVFTGVVGDEEGQPENITIIKPDRDLFLSPLLPDKSVVVRPVHTLQIVPGSQMFSYISIPLTPTLALHTARKGFDTLVRFKGSGLSLTWFGDPVSGESAYAINTPIYGGGSWEDGGPWEAYCPLVIRNDSTDILSFKKMVLRVPFLSLFAWDGGFITNGLTISFRGRSQVSQIQISKEPPVIDRDLHRYRGPQKKKDSLILRRSFSFIKTLSQY